MKLIDLKCPRCGATLDAKEIIDYKIVCSYCGNTFLLQEEDTGKNSEILKKNNNTGQKKIKKFDIIFPIIIIIFAGGLSFLGVYLQQKKNQVQKQKLAKIRKIQKLTQEYKRKQQKQAKEILNKTWFIRNIQPFSLKDFNKIKQTLIKLKIPTFGSKNPDLEIYHFIWTLSHPRIKDNKNLLKQYPNISITYIPIISINILKYKKARIFYNILFEAILERSTDGFIDVINTNKHYPKARFENYYNLLTCDKQAMKLAIKKNLHKNKIKKLQYLNRQYRLFGKENVFVKNNKTNKIYKLETPAIFNMKRSIKLILDPNYF